MTAPTNFVWKVDAYKWQCEDCHDAGLERDEIDASRALADHRDEYHDDTEALIDANRCPACNTTYDDCPMPAAGCCWDCNHDK